MTIRFAPRVVGAPPGRVARVPAWSVIGEAVIDGLARRSRDGRVARARQRNAETEESRK
jgi:hypothetical protein